MAGDGHATDMHETVERAKRAAAAAARRLLDLMRAHPASAAALVTALVSLVFLLAPGIDTAVAALFFHGPAGFPAERNGFLLDLRAAGMGVTRIVVVGLVLAGLAKVFLPMLARALPARKLLFVAASMALGPGLLVNSLLKEWWGRPRPRQIVEFGGTMEFFPAWIPGGACVSNCSFPSGEASSAMWLLAFAFVVPERWRRAAIVAVVAWALAISLNRMAFGAHFLSDVTIGWGLMATVVLACRWFFLTRIGPMTEARIDAGLAMLGDRLLALVGGRAR